MTFPSVELPVLSVSLLTQSIKTLIENQFRFVCVQGEISNCKLQTSGHLYFSLKDTQAQISAVMFKADLAQLTRLPKDGDHVILKGSLNVYPPSGKYQIVVRSLELAGLGALLLKLEELKVKLKERGFFEISRKKPLPKFPKSIGIVTSPTGAVIQDVVHVLTRRFSGFHLILNPVKVQGDGAAQEIASAIDFFNRTKLVDVMIVGRGGGSIEDLWAFNEQIVAEAIFRSTIPIISAVGHETDHCIADYVADVRAPTPSAAAEMVIAEKAHQLNTLEQWKKALQQTVFHLIKHNKEKLLRISKHPIFASPYTLLGPKIQRLDELRMQFDRTMNEQIKHYKLKLLSFFKQNEALKPSSRILHFKDKLITIRKNLDYSIKKKLELENKHLNQTLRMLKALDPRNILSKGYSIIFSEKRNSIINSVRSLSEGEKVKLILSDGNARSTINEINCE